MSQLKKKYQPTISNEFAEKLRQWQENVYKESSTRDTQIVTFLGRKIIVPPKVHPINAMSDLLGNSVIKEVTENDRVLDMGTGSGVNAILAASKSNNVVGVDINPEAIKIAKENAKVNNLEAKIQFEISDVFSNVKGKFDVIIFDPPFRWFAPRDIYELGTTDENYHSLTKFFSEVGNYLEKKGRILLCFGTSGDMGYLEQLIKKHEFVKEVMAHRDLLKEGIKVDYYTFRLTKS